MEVSSSHQMNVFLLCILSGMLCGVFFDIQRFLRRLRFAGKMRVTLEDILFALVSIALTLGFGFRFNNGEIRYYQIMGSISGVLFYAAFLSRLVMKALGIIYKVLRNVIVVPTVKICLFLAVPIKKLIRIFKKAFLKLRRLLKKALSNIKKRKKRLKKRMKML